MSTQTQHIDIRQPSGKGPSEQDKRFFGHPRGLATLFFTEMWERFSYYGMRALLILFMTAGLDKGGLGFDVAKSGAIYGLYTAMVYLANLPGGWIADRILGQRRAVLYGGIVIALGHFSMAVPGLATFYLGLSLIVIGTGLLKPNISTMVGQLYSASDHRRDAGFSIFYMGINIGAFLSPLICGYVGENINWHWGFGLAGLGMTLGLIQYKLGGKYLGSAGVDPVPASPAEAAAQKRRLWIGILATAAATGTLALLSSSGAVQITPERIANIVGVLLIALSAGVFAWLLGSGDWTPVEKKRFVAIGVFFLASALFWSAFEQAGSTLNLFAERSTDKHLFGYAYPTSWFQSLNSLYIIFGLAPAIAWLWVRLGSKEPSSPAKFSLGLIFVGLGFIVMVIGAMRAQSGTQVSSVWLWVTYLLHTIGELCLSPVGLSVFTKLAPARVAGLMMGVWFLSTSIGDYIGGRMASFYESWPLPALFGAIAAFCIVLGAGLALFVKPMKKLMGGVN